MDRARNVAACHRGVGGLEVSTVIEMLETYGHGDVDAMEEVDANFADGRRVRHTRTIEELAA